MSPVPQGMPSRDGHVTVLTEAAQGGSRAAVAAVGETHAFGQAARVKGAVSSAGRTVAWSVSYSEHTSWLLNTSSVSNRFSSLTVNHIFAFLYALYA